MSTENDNDTSKKHHFYRIPRNKVTREVTVYSCQRPECNKKFTEERVKCTCGGQVLQSCWYQKITDEYRYVATDTDLTAIKEAEPITENEFNNVVVRVGGVI